MAGSRNFTAPVLSKRLRMLADMVTPGSRLADVGCDHGFLDIYLVGEGICPQALAMDVRQGPLAGAGEHIREYGLENYIETRLSDGLACCAPGEADTLVCAGMGGRLMERILREGMDRVREMRELILQPQSEIPQFRVFLRRAGFRILWEDAVLEEGKYYFAMKAVPGELRGRTEPEESGDPKLRRLYDLFGEHLLERRHPVLKQYLEQRREYLERLERTMTESASEKGLRRLEEIRAERQAAERALLFWEGKAGQV